MVIGRPAAADGMRDLLRFRYHRNQRDVGKQRQPAQRAFMYSERMLRACTTNTISRCGCSMIAATATDHIGANPVPLATRTVSDRRGRS
jgi:hypothetical protein